MKLYPRQITLYAILISAALVISLFESWLPSSFLPVPGIKLGLANIVTLFAVYYLGALPALIILICRCILASLFGGGFIALFFSLCGGISAIAVMLALKPLDGRIISIYGVSISGAAAHGIGQILAAAFFLQSFTVFYYLPFLLLSAIFTGALTAYLADFLFNRLHVINEKNR